MATDMPHAETRPSSVSIPDHKQTQHHNIDLELADIAEQGQTHVQHIRARLTHNNAALLNTPARCCPRHIAETPHLLTECT